MTQLDAHLYCEPCNLMGVGNDEVDFIYDTGTVSGVMGEKEKEILKSVEDEDVLIETVTGERSISKQHGDTIFGKTRILKGRQGSVLVSQFSSKHMYQVLNPDEDTFILRGWNHNPTTKGKVWYFSRDEDRYGDKLLHCTVKVEQAKCFANREEKFYNPVEQPKLGDKAEEAMIAKVQAVHCRWSHASFDELSRLMKNAASEFEGISEKDLLLWKEKQGNFCTGCIQGAMKEHPRYKSTKPLKSDKPGEKNVGDIMYVENAQGVKKPLYVQVDVCTKLVTGVAMKNKTEDECKSAILAVKTDYGLKGREMKTLTFDREPSVVPLENHLKEHGIELILKAAGQKVGLAEVNIRIIRVKARSTKAGVRDKYGYLPPNQFNMDLCLDCVQVINRLPKTGQDKSPYEIFTGKEVDYLRDFRAEWGEILLVKKPKQLASDLNVTGEWAAVVRRIMNGTGVLKVYLVQSKKYAYRLHFKRAKAPEWVLEELQNLKTSAIGFEIEEDETTRDSLPVEDDDNPVHGEIDERASDDDDLILHDPVKNTVLMQAVDTLEQGLSKIKDEYEGGIEKEPRQEDDDDKELSHREETVEVQPMSEPGVYYTRSGRAVKPPERYGFEKALAVIEEVYNENLQHLESSEQNEIIEICGMMKAMLFQHAVSAKPEEAMKALKEEVRKAIKIDIWDPVFLHDLTEEEKKLIIPQMMNYLEKYKPDKTFEKFKVRVLNRGDKQIYTGETEGPVTRVESLLMLLSIAAHENLTIFKVDVGSAFMRTPMVDDVKHKWVKLDKLVVKVLQELEPGKYEPYVLQDGSVIVKMKKISYGYVEAAHYWYKDLSDTFFSAGYNQSKKDKCVFIKKEDGNMACCATTVDDCLFVTSNDGTWIQKQIEFLKAKYEDVAVEMGDEIGLIGMQVKMDRIDKKVILTQPKNVDRIITAFGVDKGAPTPALANVMGDDDTSPLLQNQKQFMSLNSMLMFIGQRTYPEIRPAVIKLSTKYNKATELDLCKATRVAQYVYGCKETHQLILAPKSLKMVCSADASYAEHADGKSHSGGTVGFESDTCCNFAFISCKQPVVAKSVGEAELIAQNRVGDYVEWAREMLLEFGYPQETVPMYVDSQCAMQMLQQGTGSFKRAKHIKVQLFWMKELLDNGSLKLIYMPTDELVADILTKPLTGWKFQYLLYKLIGWNSSKLLNCGGIMDQVAEEV